MVHSLWANFIISDDSSHYLLVVLTAHNYYTQTTQATTSIMHPASIFRTLHFVSFLTEVAKGLEDENVISVNVGSLSQYFGIWYECI